jgi:hypothetical protein
MRILLALLAGAALLAACGSSKNRASTKATSEPLITADPRLLVLPADQLPAPFTAKDGSIVSAQWSRSWDRDPNDSAATGATRVTINAVLEQTVAQAVSDFDSNYGGSNGQTYAQRAIQARGFQPAQIKVAPADVGSLGVDQQEAVRVEFTRGTAEASYVQYFVYMRVRNTLAQVTAFAQNKDGAEAPKLLDDLKSVAKKQADHLRSLPVETLSAPSPARRSP